MKVVLYQIALEEKNARLLFRDLQSIKVASGSRVPAEAYEAVYHGEVDAKTLEDIFCICKYGASERILRTVSFCIRCCGSFWPTGKQ